jgi:hypothetical protein
VEENSPLLLELLLALGGRNRMLALEVLLVLGDNLLHNRWLVDRSPLLLALVLIVALGDRELVLLGSGTGRFSPGANLSRAAKREVSL